METIIFIHKGDSWYLPYALHQCVKSNPSARVILLGDVANKKYNNIVEHQLIEDYSLEADEFSKLYQHYSTSSYNYELFCGPITAATTGFGLYLMLCLLLEQNLLLKHFHLPVSCLL